jgi:hypothetical protein
LIWVFSRSDSDWLCNRTGSREGPAMDALLGVYPTQKHCREQPNVV